MSAANWISPGVSSVPTITRFAFAIGAVATSGVPFVFRPMISAVSPIWSPVVCS